MTERTDRLIVLAGATIAAVGFGIPFCPLEYAGVLLAVFRGPRIEKSEQTGHPYKPHVGRRTATAALQG